MYVIASLRILLIKLLIKVRASSSDTALSGLYRVYANVGNGFKRE